MTDGRQEYMEAIGRGAEALKIGVFVLAIFLMLVVFGFGFYFTFRDGDNTRECERYEAARIPQDMNPCWGSIKK